jgi:hypothetical protein
MEKGAVILIIRSILTMWLCYAIFCETGPFTAFAFFLIFFEYRNYCGLYAPSQ